MLSQHYLIIPNWHWKVSHKWLHQLLNFNSLQLAQRNHKRTNSRAAIEKLPAVDESIKRQESEPESFVTFASKFSLQLEFNSILLHPIEVWDTQFSESIDISKIPITAHTNWSFPFIN